MIVCVQTQKTALFNVGGPSTEGTELMNAKRIVKQKAS